MDPSERWMLKSELEGEAAEQSIYFLFGVLLGELILCCVFFIMLAYLVTRGIYRPSHVNLPYEVWRVVLHVRRAFGVVRMLLWVS